MQAAQGINIQFEDIYIDISAFALLDYRNNCEQSNTANWMPCLLPVNTGESLGCYTLRLLDIYIQIIFPYLLRSLDADPVSSQRLLVYIRHEDTAGGTDADLSFISLFDASVATALRSMQLERDTQQSSTCAATGGAATTRAQVQVLHMRTCGNPPRTLATDDHIRLRLLYREGAGASPQATAFLSHIEHELELKCYCDNGGSARPRYSVRRYRHPTDARCPILIPTPCMLACPAPAPHQLLAPVPVVVITGGLGGVGLSTAKVLADLVCAGRSAHATTVIHIVLVTSRAPVVDSATGQRQYGLAHRGQSRQLMELQRLLALRGPVEVHIMTCDVSQLCNVGALWANISVANWQQQEPGGDSGGGMAARVVGVVHSAGVLASDATNSTGSVSRAPQLAKDTSSAIALTWGAKATGAWNIHTYLMEDAMKYSLGAAPFFISYSSIASVVGNPGYSCYCAANAFIAELMGARNISPHCKDTANVAVHWPPIAGVGMAAATNTDTPAFSMDESSVCRVVGSILGDMPVLKDIINSETGSDPVVGAGAGALLDSGYSGCSSIVLMPSVFRVGLTVKGGNGGFAYRVASQLQLMK